MARSLTFSRLAAEIQLDCVLVSSNVHDASRHDGRSKILIVYSLVGGHCHYRLDFELEALSQASIEVGHLATACCQPYLIGGANCD
jgi:hypothetical protein